MYLMVVFHNRKSFANKIAYYYRNQDLIEHLENTTIGIWTL